jgi:hypothetical protein
MTIRMTTRIRTNMTMITHTIMPMVIRMITGTTTINGNGHGHAHDHHHHPYPHADHPHGPRSMDKKKS